ncbi:hypothetical protein AGMMS49975_09980 [Clostridia bacterium]|nr:hypothetical protein AGMMS49975_09980 [Clostridia bacterium]
MKRRLGIALSIAFAATIAATDPSVNINIPTADKNWFDNYLSEYVPASTLPKTAPSAIGFKTLSDDSLYEYKQLPKEFNAQAASFYINSFKEIFSPSDQRVYADLTKKDEGKPPKVVLGKTGVDAFDKWTPNEYAGLSDEELKWLVNNNIVSRDPKNVSVTLGSISVGEVEPLYFVDTADSMGKSEFLMALHKATYGVIESRPVVFDITAFRKASKITWTKLSNGYRMNVGEFADQEVDSTNRPPKDSGGVLDRNEFKVRLENDTHFVVATYPDHDKLFVTSPNVGELYVKSLLDKGILDGRNLIPTYNSKNLIKDGATFKTVFSTYGKIDETKSQYYPAYAPQLGPYDSGTGMSHVFFVPKVTTATNQLWGKRYSVGGGGITLTGDDAFFVTEDMITMDALKFVEAILRVREGDMTDTEARICSYKYGANIVDSLTGSDKSTVMYLTAKGILNFEDTEEYSFLYEPFQKEFAFELLYRVANPAARKNFSEIQLTDSDNFWIGKGFGSYDKTVRVPNVGALQEYRDKDGNFTVDPRATGGVRLEDKNILSLVPSVDNAKVEVSEGGQAVSRTVTTLGRDGLPVVHDVGIDIENMAGVDRYADKDFLKPETPAVASSPLAFNTERVFSPFAAKPTETVSDKKNATILVDKIVDDPYKYIYDKKSIVVGDIPATKEARAGGVGLSPDASPEVKSVKYQKDADEYIVTFEVTSTSYEGAIQYVDGKLEVRTGNLTIERPISVVSRVTKDGQAVMLVARDSLPVIDPEIVVVEDRILLNKRTNTKAVLLDEQNVAYVGNEIIEVGDDVLMVVATDNQVYYNLDVIRSLLSNTYLSKISSKDFYSCGSFQPEVYKDVYTERGDKVATAIVGSYEYESVPDRGDGPTPTPVRAQREFINLSQMTTGSNVLIKKLTRKSPEGIEVGFTVVVEYELSLPTSDMVIDEAWSKADTNPSINDINRFYYTRPPDTQTELQEYWDNNIAISNALANALYGTDGDSYITCGYLIPNVTLLFEVDDEGTKGGSYSPGGKNELQPDVIVPIAGAWFQEVGEKLPAEWVKKFFGPLNIYNKILTKADAEKFGGEIAAEDGTYTVVGNDGSKYFPQKAINFGWFPAWVHSSFNNSAMDVAYNAATAENGRAWRNLTASRGFSYLPRGERRSDGTLFGGKRVDDVAWMLLPSGALYRSMGDGSTFKDSGDRVIATTRVNAKDFGNYVGKTLEYDGKSYYVSRFDQQYLELIAVDSVEGFFMGDHFVGTDGNKVLQEVGYQTVRDRFAGDKANHDYANRQASIDNFRTLNNYLPSHVYEANAPQLLTDASGSFAVREFSTELSDAGVSVKARDLSKAEYEKGVKVKYHPVVRLSVLAWDVTGAGNGQLNYHRTLAGLLFNDMFPASLTKTVVETQVAKAVKPVPLNDLPDGSMILFGDISLMRVGDGFVTAPVRVTSSSVPKVENGVIDQKSLQKQLSGVLNLPVDSDGSIEAIADYFKEVRLAPTVKQDFWEYALTMVANSKVGNAPMIATGIDSLAQALSTSQVNSVSYYVTFYDGLQCIPVSTESKRYQLLLSSSERGKGTVTSEPYFQDAPQYTLKDTLAADAFVSDFNPLPDSDRLKAEFKENNKKDVGRDTAAYVKKVLCAILAYLMMMCVIVWFGIKNNAVKVLLDRVKHPANGTKGWDLAAGLTLGIVDIDNTISGGRLVCSMFALCALFAMIITIG